MKLLSLKITSDFRNLKGVNLQFDPANDTYVIIGNNGTGKTNILEALSSVFSVLLAHSQDFLFSFVLRYNIEDVEYWVKHKIDTKTTEYKKNNEVVNEAGMTYPSRIVCNYSGEDTRMWNNYYKKPNEDYMNSVRTAAAPDVLSMVYIDKTMWKYVLLCMLTTRNMNVAFDQFLKEKLHIASDGINTVEMKLDEAKLRRWRADNQITLFLNQLRHRLGSNEVLASSNVEDFNPNEDDARELFNKFIGASQVIDSLNIYYNQGIESAFLSEGEKKMMVILFILEAIADERTLVLMDEPDSHLHISRKAELNEMFHQMEHRSNIITSHSPTLTASFEKSAKESIIMLDRNADGKIKVIDRGIVNLVEKLTEGIWTSQKQNLFLASHDDILIVEGPTDETFISAALKCFQKQGKYVDLAFEYIPCGGASNVKAFAQKFTPKEGQTVIAFFDGDKAGESSMNNVIPCTLSGKTQWNVGNFGKARKNGNTWFSFYPPYARRRNKEHFNVEDYFTCKLFRKYIFSFSSLDTVKGKEGLKSILDKDCKKGNIDSTFYEKFSTLFDHIKAIKDAEKAGQIIL